MTTSTVALLCGLGTVYSVAQAQESASQAAPPAALASAPPRPDTSTWLCRLCPFDGASDARYTAGVSAVSDDSAPFGDASGYDEAGAYLDFGAAGFRLDEDRRLAWQFDRLGLDSRSLSLQSRRVGSYRIGVDYREQPRRQFDTTRTIFSQAGDALLLPTGWVQAASTAGFSALGAELMHHNIGSDRKTLTLNGEYRTGSRVEAYSEYRHAERTGVKLGSGAFFTTASGLVQPFDHALDEVDAGLRFRAGRSRLQLAYFGSYFDNAYRRLGFEHPFTTPAGATITNLAENPDSNAQQLTLSGSFTTNWHGTALTYSASEGMVEQDDSLLAYTANSDLVSSPLPRRSLDGRIDTRSLSFAVSSVPAPLPRARIRFSYRSDDRDNRTPITSWDRVVVDSYLTDGSEVNSPLSYQRRRYELSGDIDIAARLRLSGAYEYRQIERDFQEVAKQDEKISWGRLRWKPAPGLEIAGKWGSARRGIDRYDLSQAAMLGQNPLLRKYYLAYRYREFGELSLSASLPRRPFSVSAGLRVADDDYSDSLVGLLSSDDRRLFADLSWNLADVSVHLGAALDEIDALQAGSEFGEMPDWHADHADRFRHWSAGARWDSIGERFGLEVDLGRGSGSTEIVTTAVSSGVSRFPEIRSDHDTMRLSLRYRRSEKIEGRLDLRYERFAFADWALNDVQPSTIPNLLSLGAAPYDYDVVLLGVSVSYRVDP